MYDWWAGTIIYDWRNIYRSMKILAIEKEITEIDWNDATNILKQEVKQVYQLYLADQLREIYFTENKNAVLILETENKDQAQQLLNTLPLVQNKMIEFDVMELRPYTGFERIIK